MIGMKRSAQALLEEYLTLFPCVAIVGPRQCGKTTLLASLDEAWRVFDLERGGDFQAVSDDPDLFLSLHTGRIAIDEAQILPALFPALRVAIDADRGVMGRYIVTGSSSPELARAITESLAGRVGIIELAPLSWSEVRPADGPSVIDLLLDPAVTAADLVGNARARGDLKALTEYWFKGGYPEPWVRNDPRFREIWMDQYVRAYVLRDVARLFPGLNQEKFRTFARMLGACPVARSTRPKWPGRWACHRRRCATISRSPRAHISGVRCPRSHAMSPSVLSSMPRGTCATAVLGTTRCASPT